LQAEHYEFKQAQAGSQALQQQHVAAVEQMQAMEKSCQELEALCEQRLQEAQEARREGSEASRSRDAALAEALKAAGELIALQEALDEGGATHCLEFG
jgi:hypothetical protein